MDITWNVGAALDGPWFHCWRTATGRWERRAGFIIAGKVIQVVFRWKDVAGSGSFRLETLKIGEADGNSAMTSDPFSSHVNLPHDDSASELVGRTSARLFIMDTYASIDPDFGHVGGVFPSQVLREIEKLLPPSLCASAETGCGKSTILFSAISANHKVFALDDSAEHRSSVNFYRDCPLTRRHVIEEVFGPTQRTLRAYLDHERYDAVLIDGPHGWPFPELEYFFFYPHIAEGGFLILDDVNIPTIGRMADILAEDEMWRLLAIPGGTTAVFQRTSAPLFDPTGDGWWGQTYNRRRVSKNREIYLEGAHPQDAITSQELDKKLHSSFSIPILNGFSRLRRFFQSPQ